MLKINLEWQKWLTIPIQLLNGYYLISENMNLLCIEQILIKHNKLMSHGRGKVSWKSHVLKEPLSLCHLDTTMIESLS